MARKLLLFFGHLLLVVVLTGLTQIGGLVWLLALLLVRLTGRQFRLATPAAFAGLYILSTFVLVPPLAASFGREPVAHSPTLRPANRMTVWLNRNYVRPELNALLARTTERIAGTDLRINYLDANFPFLDGFPLPPHLSHNDGRKIDLSLVYETANGKVSLAQRSLSGYGVFVPPRPGETDQPARCAARGHWQYALTRYARLWTINKNLRFSERGTKTLFNALLADRNTGKILIEPHLEQRLGLTHDRVRYHGCHAVRHDDHLHLQLR